MDEISRALRLLPSILTRAERWRAANLVVLAVIAASLEALSIGAILPFMALLMTPDAIFEHPAAKTFFTLVGPLSADGIVLLGAAGLLVLYLLKNALLLAFFAYQSRFVSSVEARIAGDLLSNYLWEPYGKRHSRNSADRIRIITNEAAQVANGVLQGLVTIVSELLVLIAIVVLLLVAQPLVTAVALPIVGLVAVMMQTVFRRKLDAYRESRVTTLSGMFRWINQGLGALKEIKVLGRQNYVLGEFKKNSVTYAHGTYIFNTLNVMPRLIFETAAVAILAVAVVASIFAGTGLTDIVPALMIFGLATIRLLPSASRLVTNLNALRYYGKAVETVAVDLQLEKAANQEPAEGRLDVAVRKGAFEFLTLENVSFRYPGSARDSLHDIYLRIERGEAIAILGRSGSGKTTLIDLLLGLQDPTSGKIAINGREVGSLSGEWRGIAGLVPQEYFLIDDSVRRNVAFGLPDPSIEESRVWRALEMARLDARVRSLPNGLDTSVGERGATLSAGERQRLGIARALYTDPEILVLDEATASLDTVTEAEFVAVLHALRGIKTILTITHRMEAAQWCDRAIVLGDGRIKADGAFSEVLQLNTAPCQDRP